MDIGISSACFYPLETEKSVVRACETGAKTIEIFMNADSEFKPEFVKNMAEICKSYGVKVASVHTMGSFTESFHLFSSYNRRYYEAKETSFKRHFDVLHTLGAEILVMHGIKKPGSISDEEYFDMLKRLCIKNVLEGECEMHLNGYDIGRLPDDFEMSINSEIYEKGAVHICVTPADIDKGFILVYGDVEINCTLKAVFDENMDRLKDMLSTALF